MIQLELPLICMAPDDKISQVEYLVHSVKESNTRVTRRLWAENRALKQMLFEVSERLQIIEKNICHGSKNLNN
jgi:hypothetical protein